jgi:hypothetical protein
MARNFIACDREQELLLPPSLREWLPEEHLAWFVLDAVGEMDLAAFYAPYRDDGRGRAAHDPAMMFAPFVYAYAIRSERLAECRRRLRQDWELERRVVSEHAAWHAAGIASDGSRRMAGARHNIKPFPLPFEPAGKINVSDPDSRNLKTTRGVQGYNAQAVVGEGQIVLAAEISVESLDTANLQPVVEAALRELDAAGVTDTPGVVLADAGYWKNDVIEALCTERIPTLVAPDADRRKAPPAGRRGRFYDFARRVLASDWGTELYLHRQGMVEPVFGQGEVQPRRQPVPSPRQITRQIEMAAADGHPQPAETSPPPARDQLTARRAAGHALRLPPVPRPSATSTATVPAARSAFRDSLREERHRTRARGDCSSSERKLGLWDDRLPGDALRDEIVAAHGSASDESHVTA